MRLKMQMVVAGFITLAIPLVGLHSIRQLDNALEDSRKREQLLRVNNAVIALSTNAPLGEQLLRRETITGISDLYAARARFPVFIDGYADDWRELAGASVELTQSDHSMQPPSANVSVRVTARDATLYMFVDVDDDAVVFHQPPAPVFLYAEGEEPDAAEQLSNGDALEVFVQRPNGRATHALFRAVAPGPLIARAASKGERRRMGAALGTWRGYWTATSSGMQLEMSIPLPPDGSSLGIAYVDVDERGQGRKHWVGSLDPFLMAQRHTDTVNDEYDPRLWHASQMARDTLSSWVTPSTRARLFDGNGRLLADVNALYLDDETSENFDPAKSSLWDALVYRFVSAMLRDRSGEQFSTPRYERIDGLHLPNDFMADQDAYLQPKRYQTDESDFVLGTFAPLPPEFGDGFLLFEANDSRASSYAGSRFAQLLSLLILVSVAVGGSLLMFATVLSFRIRRLSKQASAAVSRDGRIAQFQSSSARDEIGELSRTIGSQLGRTKNYTQYLEALSSRLSHELRTPLSVVRTSIENIDTDPLDAQTVRLLERAGGGADQLGHIIKALVESTRLEQTVHQAQKMDIPLDEFMDGALARYQQVYPKIDFTRRNLGGDTVFASPELLQQALDKMVDNAVSFTTNASVALVASQHTRHDKRWVTLAVSNSGVLREGTDVASVFDPMFSSRANEDGNLHLGLGLYIVRMVAEAHQGNARMNATNGYVTVAMDIPGKPRASRRNRSN